MTNSSSNKTQRSLTSVAPSKGSEYVEVFAGGQYKGRVFFCLGICLVCEGTFTEAELLEVRERRDGYPEEFYAWAAEKGFIYSKVFGSFHAYYNKYFSGGSTMTSDELFTVWKTCPDKYAHYPRK